jgi:hypothetical protein
MLFGEALIHATGVVRSQNQRCIIIGGHTSRGRACHYAPTSTESA